jgi:hypothetical protein
MLQFPARPSSSEVTAPSYDRIRRRPLQLVLCLRGHRNRWCRAQRRPGACTRQGSHCGRGGCGANQPEAALRFLQMRAGRWSPNSPIRSRPCLTHLEGSGGWWGWLTSFFTNDMEYQKEEADQNLID